MARDWRLENLDDLPFLRGVAFVRKPYRAYREGWDHDHCAACGVKLAEPDMTGDDIVHEGYATTSDFIRGADYEWVCVPCFSTFQKIMDWKVSAESGF
jgi:hypothetical protein